MRLLLLLIFTSCLFACNNEPKENAATAPAFKDGLNAAPMLANTDSIQIIYYDEPEGDSLRYARFFTYTSVSKKETINALLANLDKSYVTLQEKKPCRSFGKIYCYKKDEILKTIYFSTKGGDCSYLYYIINGEFLYFDMDEKLKTLITEHKKEAVAPVATQ
ncbi:hypothetical protein [Aridibaculum aurantiacum]|uniref:hypothetical protein n=1 Tax=Aridibaculum aurantiacum TaxID=2810307 RepID=UPI001A956F31|nr:hypothetical protein [Aridibaculum aurantiacum]